MAELDLCSYCTYVQSASKITISRERLSLLSVINGEVFYPLHSWPLWIKQLFWSKPLIDKGVFQITLYLVGNGCPLEIVAKWALSSQYWVDYPVQLIRSVHCASVKMSSQTSLPSNTVNRRVTAAQLIIFDVDEVSTVPMKDLIKVHASTIESPTEFIFFPLFSNCLAFHGTGDRCDGQWRVARTAYPLECCFSWH